MSKVTEIVAFIWTLVKPLAKQVGGFVACAVGLGLATKPLLKRTPCVRQYRDYLAKPLDDYVLVEGKEFKSIEKGWGPLTSSPNGEAFYGSPDEEIMYESWLIQDLNTRRSFKMAAFERLATYKRTTCRI